MTSQIRVDEITNRSGLGTVTIYDNGFEFTGVTTFTEDVDITGGLTIGGVLTYEDVTNIDSVGVVTARGGVKVPDSQKVFLGTGDDLQIYHNGNHSIINNSTGDLRIESDRIELLNNASNEFLLTADANGAVSLYYDNSKKFETTSSGVTVTGTLTATTFSGSGASLTAVDAATLDGVDSTSFLRSDVNDIKTAGYLRFEDGVQLTFGTGGDMEIFHNGINGYVRNSVTGNLYLANTFNDGDVIIQSDNGSGGNATYFLADGSTGEAILYHYGSEKFATKSDGVKITGGLQDKDGDLGSSGQVLSSTGTALNWVDADSGPQGVQGIAGSDGNDGAQGTAGSDGVDGTNGTNGTNGTDGNDGAQGIAGSDGVDGTNGTNGTNGTDGNDGAQGIAGSDGIDGTNGTNGTNGTDGNDGAQGIAGSDGVDGTNGTNGTNGTDGNDGAQGTAGTQGSIGPDGGNAGTLDNLDSSQFLRSDAADNCAGDITFDGGAGAVTIANNSDIRFQTGTWTGEVGTDTAKIQYHSNHLYLQSQGSWRFRNGSGTNIVVIDSSGNLSANGTVTASSDIKLKKNISTIDNALDKVLNLRGVEFDYIESGEHNIGVIAQEVEEVLPDLVHTDENTDTKSVAYGNLTAVLIEAVKELKKENDALSARIQSLEDR